MKTSILKPIVLGVVTFLFYNTQAQTTESKTVRIKKTEIVNGISSTSDTTYTISGSDATFTDQEGNTINLSEINRAGNKGKIKKVIVLKDSLISDSLSRTLTDNEIQTILSKDIQINDLGNSSENPGNEKRIIKIISIKMDITEADLEELKKLGKNGTTDQQLKVEKINFYPNPNDGKFNLSFELKERGNTDINIMNIEGKNVYHEFLENFSGTYKNDIDISKNNKGIYFIKVQQGSHSMVKKIIVE